MSTESTAAPAAPEKDDFGDEFDRIARERDSALRKVEAPKPNEGTPADEPKAEAEAPPSPAPSQPPKAQPLHDEEHGREHGRAAAPAAPPAAPAAAKPPKLDDLIGFVPADQREAYRAMLTAAQADQQRLRSEEGRIAAYQAKHGEAVRKAQELETKVKALEAKPASATNDADKLRAQEEADELAKEFPELSGPLNMRIKRMVESLMPPKQAASQPDPKPNADANPAGDPADVKQLADQHAALMAAHPDYKQIAVDDVFKTWVKRQPPAVQKLASSEDATDAIYVLDNFKREVASARQRAADEQKALSRKRLEENVGIKGNPARVTSAPDDFGAAFDYFASRKQPVG